MQQGNFIIKDEKNDEGKSVIEDYIDDDDTLCYT